MGLMIGRSEHSGEVALSLSRAEGRHGFVVPFETVESLDAELSEVALAGGLLQVRLAEGLEVLGRCAGHHELGFSSIEAYALERCERSARWVQGLRALARRVAGLPAVRQALVSGEIRLSMAHVIAGVATPADEAWWLVAARGRTVRQMRQLVRERKRDKEGGELPPADADGEPNASPGGAPEMFAEEDRATLTVTVDRETAWLFESARMLSKQLGDRTMEATLEALLAEGSTSLWGEMEREDIVPFEPATDERAGQRAWEKELARFRDEAEAVCEKRMVNARGDGPEVQAPARWARGAEHALAWGGDAQAIDAQLRCVAAELARRDLRIGELAEKLWAADGWRRLGYATESQYVRERLGMSLSSLKAKRALARRARVMPELKEAVCARGLGFEGARLVAAVASRETVKAWVERAGERTVKHLREEVDAAEMLGRLGVDENMWPPDDKTMDAIAAMERSVVSGSALQSDESQMFATDSATPVERTLRSRARVTFKFRVGAGTQRHYRWLERLYLRHGPLAGSFLRYLCTCFIAIWRERGNRGQAYAEVYARDLFRCTSPVCSRRDVTPHHLLFRSAGGDDSDENLATLCVCCHLEGVHGGRLTVEPPASAMQWRIGRSGHTYVH